MVTYDKAGWEDVFKPFTDMKVVICIGRIRFDILLDDSFFNENEYYGFVRHAHHAFELHFVTRGEGRMLIGEEVIPLTPGTNFLIAPGLSHRQIENPENPIKKFCFQFKYTVQNHDDLATPKMENDRIVEILQTLVFFYVKNLSQNLDLLKTIRYEIMMKRIGYYTKIQLCFMDIMLNVFRACVADEKMGYDFEKKNVDHMRDVLIENFFANRYMHPCRLDDLSSVLKMSNRQVSRILQKLYHKTFCDILTDMRLLIAKELLKNTNIKIVQIAEKVGYNEVSNFCTMFKKKTGYTPRHFRLLATEKPSRT